MNFSKRKKVFAVMDRFAARGLCLFLLILMAGCSGKLVKPSSETDELATQESDKTTYRQALTLIENKSYPQAIELLEALSAKHPDYPGPIVNTGIAYFRMGELDDAKNSFLRLVNHVRADNPAESTVEQSTEKNTEKTIEKTIEKSIEKTKEKKQASENTVKALNNEQLKPFLLTAYNYLGVLAREAGQFEESEAYYRSALNLEPDHKATIRNLAILLDLYKGDLQQAKTLYERYQSLSEAPDAKVKDWIFDINNRIGEQ